MSYQNISVQEEKPIALVEIQRPKQLNALNADTIAELSAAFKSLYKKPEIRAIVLIGSGDKAFVAGADIKEFVHFNKEQAKKLSSNGQANLFDLIEQAPKPVIAAINGYALGGGLELALACQIRVGTTTAKLGLPEVTLGLIPGYGGTQRLAQIAGKGKAMEMILTARMVEAQEALSCGLLNHVVAPEELKDKAFSIAKNIAKNSPAGISLAIRAINAGYTLENGFINEVEFFSQCFETEDFKEGTSAFMEKRKPNFN